MNRTTFSLASLQLTNINTNQMLLISLLLVNSHWFALLWSHLCLIASVLSLRSKTLSRLFQVVFLSFFILTVFKITMTIQVHKVTKIRMYKEKRRETGCRYKPCLSIKVAISTSKLLQHETPFLGFLFLPYSQSSCINYTHVRTNCRL
ncbi:hypothetical protein BDF20DRAFT_562575 [Mycotypha africana]|uniref:uncharacterized protein n=1 Tax=Mycotypha africana TaxID=64632 RepID=UPI002301640D|nr:uncharacterized protein BDF20DRAFT_562575 [Mycotypha africana]KAI8977361.1 hypothetical protein BDF20DRAFT_562575 [Mycotypha africana]